MCVKSKIIFYLLVIL